MAAMTPGALKPRLGERNVGRVGNSLVNSLLTSNWGRLRRAGLLALATVAMVVGGCASTELTSVWSDGEYNGSLERVLVVAIVKEPRHRRILEDAFIPGLESAGIFGKASYTVEGLGEDPDAEEIKAILPGEGIHGVLAVRLLGVEKETVYHPPTVEMVPYRYYDGFTGYYRTVYEQVHRPGYYSNHTIVSLESNLYDVASEKLLWSARSRTIDPKSAEKVADELATAVVKGVEKAGFF